MRTKKETKKEWCEYGLEAGINVYVQAASKIGAFLRSDQLSSGTVYDREESAASRDDHYGHSHFALLCAQIFKMTGDKSWLKSMRRAMLYCVNLWNQHPERCGHRDFNDIAVTEAYALVHDVLPEGERAMWESYLKNCRRPLILGRDNHYTIIYYTFYRLGQIFQREEDCRWARQCMNDRILPAFAPDGFWCDLVGSERLFQGAYWPMAYHPFNLVYLHRYILASGDPGARKVFLRALDATVGLVAPDGDFNVLGRDQETNFSYSALVYAYEAGAAEVADENSEKAALYREVAARAWAWLQQYLRPDGYFRVKPNELEYLRGGYDDYENNVVYAALSAIHLMWAAEVCRQEAIPLGGISADAEGHTWLPESRFLFAHVGNLMMLTGRGFKHPRGVDRRSVGMVPGFLKLDWQSRIIDLIPTPGGGTSDVLFDWMTHPRIGLLPYFSDDTGRVGHLWEADWVCEMGEIADGVRFFGEGEVLWTCDENFRLGYCKSGIRQRRLLVLHRKSGFLIFDQFLGHGLGDSIRWVPYNISFFGKPWRNDTQCGHVASVREDIRVIYAVPVQEMPFARVACSPYLSSKGPAYHFAVQPRPYSPTVIASRLAVQEVENAVSPCIALLQVTQDDALAASLADLGLIVVVNFAEKKRKIRSADASWEVEVAARGVRFTKRCVAC